MMLACCMDSRMVLRRIEMTPDGMQRMHGCARPSCDKHCMGGKVTEVDRDHSKSASLAWHDMA